MGKLKEGEEFRRLTLTRSIIFFFDVFLALMIIAGAGFFIKTQIGKMSLIFGFSMLGLSVVLRVLKKW